jgi:acylphosphatase
MAVNRARVVIRGHVQGVFFRDSARRLADREGVGGWIENRPDGAVEAVFEGEAEAVERLVRFCERGPRGASVERIERFDETPEGLTGFSIR